MQVADPAHPITEAALRRVFDPLYGELRSRGRMADGQLLTERQIDEAIRGDRVWKWDGNGGIVVYDDNRATRRARRFGKHR